MNKPGLGSLVFVLAIAACRPSASTSVFYHERVKITGTYSNLHVHDETGDLVGTEVRIVESGSEYAQYQATLQIAEGTMGPLLVTDVIYENSARSQCDEVRFSVGDPYNATIVACVATSHLIGHIEFRNGIRQDLKLPRTASFWE